jgi:hypothetical protein
LGATSFEEVGAKGRKIEFKAKKQRTELERKKRNYLTLYTMPYLLFTQLK